MASVWVLNCRVGESAAMRVERAKQEESLPADAYKGPIKKDRFGSTPAPPNVNILGTVREIGGTEYFICQRK